MLNKEEKRDMDPLVEGTYTKEMNQTYFYLKYHKLEILPAHLLPCEG